VVSKPSLGHTSPADRLAIVKKMSINSNHIDFAAQTTFSARLARCADMFHQKDATS
jgi:hypothetical protein